MSAAVLPGAGYLPDAASTPSFASAGSAQSSAIRQQRAVWSTLLNWRIQLQPLLTAANSMPAAHSIAAAQQREGREEEEEGEGGEEQEAVWREQHAALSSLDELQADLLRLQQRHGGMRARSGGAGEEAEDEEEEEGGGSDEEKGDSMAGVVHSPARLSAVLRSTFASEASSRYAVLDKWMRRTELAAGSADSSGQSLLHRSAAEQVRDAVADATALRRRTQLKRGQYEMMGGGSGAGEPSGEGATRGQRQAEAASGVRAGSAAERADATVASHPDLFDDLDFYQRLLQHAISAQQQQLQSHSAAAGLSSLDSTRRSLSSAVDRRASKGRKLQFAPIAKLSNFMAPEPAALQQHSRDEAAVDQLVNNLFGAAANRQHTAAGSS